MIFHIVIALTKRAAFVFGGKISDPIVAYSPPQKKTRKIGGVRKKSVSMKKIFGDKCKYSNDIGQRCCQ